MGIQGTLWTLQALNCFGFEETYKYINFAFSIHFAHLEEGIWDQPPSSVDDKELYFGVNNIVANDLGHKDPGYQQL